MMKRQNSVGAVSLTPLLRNGNTNGTAVDLSGYMAASVTFMCGAITNGTHTPALEDSDDNTTFAPVATANLSAAPVAFTANSVQHIEYLGARRYLRAQVNSDGANGAIYGAFIERGRAMQNDAVR